MKLHLPVSVYPEGTQPISKLVEEGASEVCLECTPGYFSLLNCCSNQNHNPNPNKTFLIPAKLGSHVFCCNVIMYVEKTTGLALLLMMWFSEILTNKPSTYVNWPYFMRGWGF